MTAPAEGAVPPGAAAGDHEPVPGLRVLVRGAAAVLAEAGVPSAEHDARALAAHVLGVDRFEPALAGETPAGFVPAFAAVVERRRRREPLQHITGLAGFRHVVLRVRPGVFVPRPETETVAQLAVDEARRVAATGRTPHVVDLCTGTGAIALSVVAEVPGARVVAVDVSPDAVALVGENVTGNGLALAAVVLGDVRDPALLVGGAGEADVVVANPPYIPPDAVPTEPEVRDHDPDLALYGGGADGLDLPRHVVDRACGLLRPGGLLVVEHAEVQAAALRAVASQRGLVDVRTAVDLTGRDRMLVARRAARAEPSGQGPVGDSAS